MKNYNKTGRRAATRVGKWIEEKIVGLNNGWLRKLIKCTTAT